MILGRYHTFNGLLGNLPQAGRTAKDVVKPNVRTFVLGDTRGHYVKEGLKRMLALVIPRSRDRFDLPQP